MQRTGDAMDFEVFGVCTQAGYGRNGYALQCCKLLEEQLLSRSESRDVNLWARVAEDINGAYWLRRGFIQVDSLTCPQGLSHAKHDFVLLLMVKKLEPNREVRSIWNLDI